VYHRHPRELAQGQGENADNSIYLERGNDHFDLELEFYTLFGSSQSIVQMYGNYSSCFSTIRNPITFQVEDCCPWWS